VRELRKVLGVTSKEDTLRTDLKRLTLPQLKRLAKSHRISLKRTVTEDIFTTSIRAPSKLKYVNALAKVVSSREITVAASYLPERKKRRRRRESSWW
jgi:hypothetical protein